MLRGGLDVTTQKLVLVLVLIGCVCLATMFFFQDFFTVQTGGEYRNITDIESAYNADAEVAQALEQLRNRPEKAVVVAGRTTGQRHIALTFDGLSDRMTIQRILDLLEKYEVRATFFADGLQAAEDPQTVVNIKQTGAKLETYTFSGMARLEKLPVERLIKDFCRSQKIIKVTTDQGPNLLKCNDTSYTEQVLQAARAAGFNGVVKSDLFVPVKQINSRQAAEIFVGGLKPGSIVSIQLSPPVEAVADEPGKTDLRPAVDKQPGLKELREPARLSGKELVEALERLLAALAKAGYTTVYVEEFLNESNAPKSRQISLGQSVKQQKAAGWPVLSTMAAKLKKQAAAIVSVRKAYAAELAPAGEIKIISTTEPALAFTFGGLANEAVVKDVLGKLQALGIKATFFVMEVEMQRYPGTVRRIIANGHEVGLAIRPTEGATQAETRQTIERGRKRLREQFGVATQLIKQPWGAVTETTKLAVSAAGCKLIGQSVNVVQSRHKDYASADQVMGGIFGKAVFSLARGQTVHFRMDYYSNDQLIGDLLGIIKQRKIDNIAYATSFDSPGSNPANDSQYSLKPVGDILNQTQYIYRYPAELSRMVPELRHEGPGNAAQGRFLAEASKRYIGNRDVTYGERMLGFSRMEARRLDTSGLIHTEDKVVFLTFDDWGTDAAINKILYVLRKHQATATFFIVTNNVLNNPNLLRTIALAGHEIGSHSDKHQPMVVRDPVTGKQAKMQDKAEYLQDLATSFRKLRAVTGDVVVNGKPALTRYFRPPTLAISRMGFEALFATGYEYIISGSGSTYDYKAESVSQLVNTIAEEIYTGKGEVRKGAILILHMGDSVACTATAIDLLLTANAAKADTDPSKFKVGRLSDYLTDGYSQNNRKKSLSLHSRN